MILDFLKNSPDRNLRLALAGAALILAVLLAFTPFKEAVSFTLFFGTYLATTGPDWREFFATGGFATMTFPSVTYVKAAAEAASVPKAKKPMTNTRRRQLAKLERESNRKRRK